MFAVISEIKTLNVNELITCFAANAILRINKKNRRDVYST